jgi:hypothetical protein
MKNPRLMLGILGALAMGSVSGAPSIERAMEPAPDFFPKGKARPQQGSRKPLRGYYANHSHVLTEYVSEKNLTLAANGKSGFKGFRKVRKLIPSGNYPSHPNQGMSIWVPA